MSRSVSRTRSARGISRFLTVFIAVLAVVVGTVAPATEAPASASVSASTSLARATGDSSQSGIAKASLTGFNPGNIISDAVFTNKNTMSEAQIQSFFNSKVSKCVVGNDENGKPFVCLKDYRISSVNRPADSYCSGYNGAANESAARIIYKVAQACNINPQVLIVMLQKEQGLVTHVWPSAWRYDSALGQGCPDTAPCDPNFVGFFHQIYGAARQMQIYMEGRWFQWYAPGNTWGILWHPNANCGRGNVYVANKATSALYYYTPYQPNAAAMRAGYGEGDGCSSYGNRNFYNYFTDWFGSTQTPTATSGMVKLANDSAVWLLSGEYRYHVTAEAFPQYKAALGDYRSIAAADLNKYKVGARGSLFVRNSASGVIAYLDGNSTHRFGDCPTLSLWGGPCASEPTRIANLTDAQFAKFKSGPEMAGFGRLVSNGRIHLLTSSSLLPLYDATVAKGLNGGVQPYAAVFPQELMASRKKEDRIRFVPGTFFKTRTAPDVWIAGATDKIFHLPSWQLAAELGLPGKVAVSGASDSDLRGYTRSGDLSPFVVCDGRTWIGASGKLSEFAGSVPAGFAAADLPPAACAALKKDGPKVTGPSAFVKFAGSAPVYHLVDGVYRHVQTHAQLAALNDGRAPVILTARAELRSKVKIGAPYPTPGTLVRASGQGEVWLVDSGSLIHLPTWEMAPELGLQRSELVVDPAALANLERRQKQSPFVVCASKTYLAAGGGLVAVTSTGGVEPTAWGTELCSNRPTSAIAGETFVTDGARTAVAVGGGFLALPDAAAISRAAAGGAATPVRVGEGYMSWLPAAQVPGEGDLVLTTAGKEVSLISGSQLVHLPNWGVGADLGIEGRMQTVSPAAVAAYPKAESSVSIFVQCRGETWVASRGVLSPLPATSLGGFAPLALTDAACATLNTSGARITGPLQLQTPDGQRYALSDGRLVAAAAQPTADTTVLTVDARTIAGMPKG
ncbi:MAG: hypothetical protein ACTMIY_00145 [Microbacterium gubbeenense]